MVRTSKAVLAALIVSAVAFADPSDAGSAEMSAPSDIPYAINLGPNRVIDDQGVQWYVDGGVWLNDPAKSEIQATIVSQSEQNKTLSASVVQLQKELSDEQGRTSGMPIWVGIAASVITTVATATATIFAATKK